MWFGCCGSSRSGLGKDVIEHDCEKDFILQGTQIEEKIRLSRRRVKSIRKPNNKSQTDEPTQAIGPEEISARFSDSTCVGSESDDASAATSDEVKSADEGFEHVRGFEEDVCRSSSRRETFRLIDIASSYCKPFGDAASGYHNGESERGCCIEDLTEDAFRVQPVQDTTDSNSLCKLVRVKSRDEPDNAPPSDVQRSFQPVDQDVLVEGPDKASATNEILRLIDVAILLCKPVPGHENFANGSTRIQIK